MNPLQEFQRLSKYSRWQGTRRETWIETVLRYTKQLDSLGHGVLCARELEELYNSVYNLQAIGSMRTLAMAGPAFERDNITGYNCAALIINSVNSFYDLAILGMAGAGVTYSVESQHIAKLPPVYHTSRSNRYYTVQDSSEGWGDAFLECIKCAYAGITFIPLLEKIRAKGAILKTKGGRASGPEPLAKALTAITKIIRSAVGRKLTALEVSDICCHIGSAVVSGGVRRTALMALFDSDNEQMTNAKTGAWYNDNIQRANANFSQVITEPAASLQVMESRLAPMFSESGEPGFFQRWVARKRLSDERDWRLSRWQQDNLLVNPCGEAILAPNELCNLSAFVARPGETLYELMLHAKMAARLGTLQAQGTHFPNLKNSSWIDNAENERLLGVGFLGYADNEKLRQPEVLRRIKQVIVSENKELSDRLGVTYASAVTAVKPAGNSGVFINAGSGLHPWHYQYILRRVTLDDHDSLFRMLRDQGAPMEQSQYNSQQWFLMVPIKAPDNALIARDVSAVRQLEHLVNVTNNYADHAVSVTIQYQEGEQDAIARYIYEHQHEIVGCTFFKNVVYPQAPISELTKEEYEERQASFPEIDWAKLSEYEADDYTTVASEMACGHGQCELNGEVPLQWTV